MLYDEYTERFTLRLSLWFWYTPESNRRDRRKKLWFPHILPGRVYAAKYSEGADFQEWYLTLADHFAETPSQRRRFILQRKKHAPLHKAPFLKARLRFFRMGWDPGYRPAWYAGKKYGANPK